MKHSSHHYYDIAADVFISQLGVNCKIEKFIKIKHFGKVVNNKTTKNLGQKDMRHDTSNNHLFIYLFI